MLKLQKHEYTLDGRPIVAKTMAKNVHCSPRKIRLVANLIRNKPVVEAMDILTFTVKPAAVPYVTKCLKAAIAAARENVAEDQLPYLIVGEVIVNDAPMMKRIRPATMGRAVRIRRRQAHIFLALTKE